MGLDEAAGTLIVHDPSVPRTMEYLLESIGKDETPIGPRAMAVVPRGKSALLDELLPKEDVETASTRMAHYRMLLQGGPAAARDVAKGLAERHPKHPVTKLVMAMQDREEGRVGAALMQLQELMEHYRKMYRKILRSLRWKRIIRYLRLENNTKSKVNLRWWWVIWILFMFYSIPRCKTGEPMGERMKRVEVGLTSYATALGGTNPR